MANIFEATAPLRAHPWFGHAFGIAAVLLAFWLRSEVEGVLKGGLPFVTFIPAIVLTTFVGGAVPGVLSAVASTLLGWYFFLPPARPSRSYGPAAP